MNQEEKELHAAYRKELVEVMAVALSAIQDLQTGRATMDHEEMWFVFQDVLHERQRQYSKWGEQHHSPVGWIPILAEEVGEVAKAAMHIDYLQVRKADLDK